MYGMPRPRSLKKQFLMPKWTEYEISTPPRTLLLKNQDFFLF